MPKSIRQEEDKRKRLEALRVAVSKRGAKSLNVVLKRYAVRQKISEVTAWRDWAEIKGEYELTH